MGQVLTIPTILPPLSEQTQIANYLDRKTKAIDQKINLLTQKTAKYKELRKAIINQTVTKGLDKNVKLKNSGIEWIGEIPLHWKLKRGKELFIELPKSKISAKEGNSEGKYKFFTSSSKQSKWLDYFLIDRSTIMFNTGGISGVNYCEKEYSYSTDSWALYSNKLDTKYYYYYFLAIVYTINKKGFKGAGIEHLQKDFIKQGLIPFLSKKEQTAIANYLDEKTGKIDAIVSNIESQINALKELRKTVINDVVTGKIRVSF